MLCVRLCILGYAETVIEDVLIENVRNSHLHHMLLFSSVDHIKR